MTISENRLNKFLESEVGNRIHLSLHPPNGDTVISSLDVNICYVSIGMELYSFSGISEGVYNKLVQVFDVRR